MTWDEAEIALRTHIETNWALSLHSSIPLVFENEIANDSGPYMLVNIEGVYSEKGVYGGPGTHLYIECGIIYFHCFSLSGVGKQAALAPVVALTRILELQTIADVIKLEGGNPPSPAEQDDNLLPDSQPGGNYYRVSGSVPFILIGP